MCCLVGGSRIKNTFPQVVSLVLGLGMGKGRKKVRASQPFLRFRLMGLKKEDFEVMSKVVERVNT